MKWEVISNDIGSGPGVRARFTLENLSRLTLDEKNWALFYNQTPRGIRKTDSNAGVIHLSGDWYKLVPREGFLLKPGEKREILVEADAWWIKETDAPQGAYFVFYDKKGEEAFVTPAGNFTVGSFTAPEQSLRHRGDLELLPTPAERYHANLGLRKLPADSLPLLLPTPVSVKLSGEKIVFDDIPEVLYEKGLEQEASYLAGMVGALAGESLTPKEASEPKANSLYLGLRPMTVRGVTAGAYRLVVRENRSVTITGSDAAGVFHGIMSLMALVPPGGGSGQPVSGIPVVTIEDAPRFPYRGLHIDIVRNFQTAETLRKMIDLMAYYKLNTLQLLLSEDEGWRIAIQALPELTGVASRRGHTGKKGPGMLHPSYGSGPFPDAAGSMGSGFYSREEFIGILRYAWQRHIRIIPTINFPGHARAAIMAMEERYRKYMEEGNEEKANEYRLIDPDDRSVYRSAQHYDDNVVCVARESVYRFYETVANELIGMYAEAGVPLELIHTGGDEVPGGAWTDSPLCRELLASLPETGDPRNLQSYFLQRVVQILSGKKLQTGGWEEVALLRDERGEYRPNPEFAGKGVIAWAWNDQGRWADLSYRLANAGYPVVLCNVSRYYFDLAYTREPEEPGLYWAGFCDVRDAWEFAPYNSFTTNLRSSMGREINPEEEYAGMERLRPGAEKNLIGLQAQLWAETIRGDGMLEYYALPKLAGLAERAWSQAGSWEKETHRARRRQLTEKEWNRFANLLGQRELPRLAFLSGGFRYRVPPPGALLEGGMLKANSEYPGLEIRYTLDGTEPTRAAALWSEPVAAGGEVKLKAFDAAGRGSRTVTIRPAAGG